MKKILILTGIISQNKKDFVSLLQDSLDPKVGVFLKKFSDLTIEFESRNLSVTIDQEDIRSFDLIYFRGVGRVFFSLAGSLAICLESLKIKYFDTAFGAFSQIGPNSDKLASSIKLTLAGLPIMPSFFCWRDKIEENIDYLIEKYGLPIVAKEVSRQRGEGVFLIKTKVDFELLKKTDKNDQFLFQKYYPAKEEYRFLVYGYQPRLFYRKITTDPNEFRSNVAVGGGFEFLPVEEAPLGMKEAAVRTAEILKLEITGIDFLVDESNKFWVLEANRGPGFTYDVKVSPEVPELASFFVRELGIQK